jgi:hypothetical protein
VPYLEWRELQALPSGTARRLYAYLEAERFSGTRWRRVIDPPLLVTLGIQAARATHQRATLRRAAAEVTANENRYREVAVVPGRVRGEHALLVVRGPRARACARLLSALAV